MLVAKIMLRACEGFFHGCNCAEVINYSLHYITLQNFSRYAQNSCKIILVPYHIASIKRS